MMESLLFFLSFLLYDVRTGGDGWGLKGVREAFPVFLNVMSVRRWFR